MLSLLLSAALAAPPAATVPQPTLAIRVDAIVAPDGSLGAGGWIVLRGGRIESIGPAAPPPGTATLEYAGGVACPGFIDPVTALGAEDELAETARAITPEANPAEAIRPGHSAFLKAARAGITTVGVAPSGGNLVGGRIAIVRTHGESGVAQLAGSGPMRLSLAAGAFDRDRAPTSRMGALPKLRELLAGDALKGGGSLLVEAATADEIRVAVDTVTGAGRTIALLDPVRADDAIDLVKGRVQAAVVGPFDLDVSPRAAALPKRLADAGVPVVFHAGGDGGALRLTAALAARSGLDAKLARQAITSAPARLLAIEGDSGSLEVGKRADLVVLDADPLDLGAKVKLVVVGGAPVDAKKESP